MVEKAHLTLFDTEPTKPKKPEVTRQILLIFGIPISQYQVTVNGEDRILYSTRKKKLTHRECEILAKQIDTALELLGEGETPKSEFVREQIDQRVSFAQQGRGLRIPQGPYSLGPFTPLIRQEASRQLYVQRAKI